MTCNKFSAPSIPHLILNIDVFLKRMQILLRLRMFCLVSCNFRSKICVSVNSKFQWECTRIFALRLCKNIYESLQLCNIQRIKMYFNMLVEICKILQNSATCVFCVLCSIFCNCSEGQNKSRTEEKFIFIYYLFYKTQKNAIKSFGLCHTAPKKLM